MKVFIKNRSDFKAAALTDSVDYDLVIHSIYDNVSNLTVVGTYPNVEGDFIVTDDFMGIIKKAAPDR